MARRDSARIPPGIEEYIEGKIRRWKVSATLEMEIIDYIKLRNGGLAGG